MMETAILETQLVQGKTMATVILETLIFWWKHRFLKPLCGSFSFV
jgi:hypothetical protein